MRDGRVRPLAMSSRQRAKMAPGVLSFSESGYQEVELLLQGGPALSGNLGLGSTHLIARPAPPAPAAPRLGMRLSGCELKFSGHSLEDRRRFVIPPSQVFGCATQRGRTRL